MDFGSEISSKLRKNKQTNINGSTKLKGYLDVDEGHGGKEEEEPIIADYVCHSELQNDTCAAYFSSIVKGFWI